MSATQLLLLPVFIHVALTAWVGGRAARARIGAVRSGETRIKDIALNSGGWPARARQLGNNFDSQFDVPLMWYGCCALLVATGLADAAAVALSWTFVATRIAHTFIHTGANNVPRRLRAFLAGFACMVAMWMWFALRLYVIG